MADATGAQVAFEVLLWGTPAALAGIAAQRAQRHTKLTWGLVCCATLVIALDKALDLQAPMMNLARVLARAVDPESTKSGSHQGMRMVLLGSAALFGLLLLLLLASRDRRFDGPKRMAIAGLALVLSLLAGRLMEGGEVLLRDPLWAWICELLAWGTTMAGIAWGLRRGPGKEVEIDEEQMLPR